MEVSRLGKKGLVLHEYWGASIQHGEVSRTGTEGSGQGAGHMVR